MTYELIISEKPKQAAKIAYALSDTKPVIKRDNGVNYFSTKYKGKNIVVASAVGHILSLREKTKSQWNYPVFDIEWAPAYSVSKKAAHTKKYFDLIKKLAKKADNFTVSTDYDIEGELIGYNIIKYICKVKDANRMKFSTLTLDELRNSYLSKSNTIDWGQAIAGETRHKLDWFYGINISRALMKAIKVNGKFKVLSSGRVQGPALKIIVDRELEIRSFISTPFWKLKYTGDFEKTAIIANHEKDKFKKKEDAELIFKKCNKKDGIVISSKSKEFLNYAPVPFDLTVLQTEAYRCFKFNPSRTLKIAQNLYLGGYMSYPRTSSQELPFSLNFNKILNNLKRNPKYTALSEQILKKHKLIPQKGKNKDPAHPAIHPTGNFPEKISIDESKLYDLIVKRFFSVFGEPAKKLSQKVIINVENEKFLTDGISTISSGWYSFYHPYIYEDDKPLPPLKNGDIIKFKNLELNEDKTKPKSRYTPASIVSALSKKNLGTKATRANIVDILYERNYIKGQKIEATELGIKIVEILNKYTPEILDEELTKSFEEDMEKIRLNKNHEDDILDKAKKLLTKVLNKFRKQEKVIGKELINANVLAGKKETLGKCPVCKEGNLILMFSKKNKQRFIACDKYPECKATFSIPQIGKIIKIDKVCEKCGYPMIKIFVPKMKGYKELCINPDCETNKSKDEGKLCPICKEGHLVIRMSKYGRFLACSNYPKCKYVQKL
jgi:DNA topoisomerase-1